MTDTQKLWLASTLFGISVLLFTIFIEWTSLELNFMTNYAPPLIKLFDYTSDLGNDFRGVPMEKYYVHGLYAAAGFGRSTSAIMGLVVPFLSVVAGVYLFTSTAQSKLLLSHIERLYQQFMSTTK